MPTRKTPFINGEFYHIYNKTIDEKRVFYDKYNSKEFYDRLHYYKSTKSTVSFSHLRGLKKESLKALNKEILHKQNYKVQVLAYTLMPTHYHILVQQVVDKGVPDFISKSTNSFTRYFNLKNKRKGQVFLKDFGATHIESEEQLIHTSRYIHLNMYSSGLVKNINDIITYPWSSFRAYILGETNALVDADYILNIFDNNRERYAKFVYDNALYQKELEKYKY